MFSVAVIEDDVITLDMITNTLENKLGATVFPFNRSKVAREFLLQQNSDSLQLIISDQIMPDFDGISLLQACFTAKLNVPFLMITADPNKTLVTNARKLGVSGFLAKPLAMNELVEKVSSVCKLTR